jgi:Flp pilus assembly pilin Flp
VGVRLDELRGDAGQTMAEYAVALTVLTVIIVAGLALMSAAVTNTLVSVVGIL